MLPAPTFVILHYLCDCLVNALTHWDLVFVRGRENAYVRCDIVVPMPKKKKKK